MAPRRDQQLDIDESEPLARGADPIDSSEDGCARKSTSSSSTTSFVLEHASKRSATHPSDRQYGDKLSYEEMDMEDHLLWKQQVRPVEKKARRVLYVLIAIGIVGWIAALFLFLGQDRRTAHSARPHDPHATSTIGHGKKVTLNQVLSGEWYPSSHAIRWILGPNGEDGLLLERGGSGGRDYLVVEDVRYRGDEIAVQKQHSTTLMRSGAFSVGDDYITASEAWPSPDHKKVLVRSNYESNWRHSGTGRYWIFDVATQTAIALHKPFPHGRVQLASWSPDSKSIVFARDNNLFLRSVDSDVKPITTDGGPELFYGVPDWVYEEEVLAGNSATWWSGDGKYIAFFRTDERAVPSFPVQYFFSRPSGKQPEEGEENYPETREIKYPKAGAPMSVVSLQIYDVGKDEVFSVTIDDDFADNDRLITEVIWAGSSGKLIVRETNRESDVLKTILIDAVARTGRTVRERDVQKLDGGWFEVTESTTFIPADPANGREHDGYIDTVIHNNWDHLAYFTPLDNPEPIMLTEGDWEVVKAPSAIDVKNNLVYFISTQDGSTQRHVYTVNLLDGPKSITPVTDTKDIGYYSASFSAASKFVLLSYQGPHIPWQKILSTPSNSDKEKTNIVIETNERLNELAKQTELPIEVYDTFTVDGFPLNVVERRPPHFDERKKYPVLFFLYNGPGAQEVSRRFNIDFQSYVASSLGYIVVTVDGRGTGFLGRKHRCAIRGNIGYWEAHDQIATAKEWAKKKYVNQDRMAIWGWSYGGFMTLKVLETDAGETFKYGMAVAPVTDWRYYDSVYTERYMHTPQHNPGGYDNATISNMTAISQNVRFLVMHGASDDNVHFQNTLSLLDKLDIAGISNYDVHIFPDSDHSIYFHNGNKMVYNKLSDWLVNAFNGEWLKIDAPQPIGMDEL